MDTVSNAITLTVIIFISAFIIGAIVRSGHKSKVPISTSKDSTSVFEKEIDKQRQIITTRFDRRMDQFNESRRSAMERYIQDQEAQDEHK